MSAIPVIDISPLFKPSPEDWRSTAQELGEACRGIGFFAVTGHGVAPELFARVFDAGRSLFAAPLEIREAVRYSAHTGNRGYIPFEGEALDPAQPPDLKEAFNIGLDLAETGLDHIEGETFRAQNLWPDLPDFKAASLAYFNAVWDLGRRLHKAFSLDLGAPADFFEDKLDRPMATLRMLHYPPRPQSVSAERAGAGVHTDYGCITLLATDDVGGLEVQTRAGDWISVPPAPGEFVCNIGDCLMRWTNDVYVSTPHRVASPVGRERYSLAFFLDPNPDALVEAIPSCVAPGEAPRYPAIPRRCVPKEPT